jgi:hypothetical protein
VILADPDGSPLPSWLAGQSIALRSAAPAINYRSSKSAECGFASVSLECAQIEV